jgi:hypothetical protein
MKIRSAIIVAGVWVTLIITGWRLPQLSCPGENQRKREPQPDQNALKDSVNGRVFFYAVFYDKVLKRGKTGLNKL